MGMVDRGGQLEVEVNQARGLIRKPGSKNSPGNCANTLLSRESRTFLNPDLAPDVWLLFDLRCALLLSDVREGVRAGERRVLGQEEDQSSEEVSGTHIPAGSSV